MASATRLQLKVSVFTLCFFAWSIACPDPGSLCAAAEEQRGEWEVTVDYFLPANAAKEESDSARQTANALIDDGAKFASWAADTSGAVGVRVGDPFPVSQYFWLGPSVGYLSGPHAAGTVTAESARTVNINDNADFSFWRPLLQAKLRFLSGLSLGGGIGAAFGHAQETETCSGSCSLYETGSGSWSGLTWELTAEDDIGRFRVGARWAGFPQFDGVTGSLGDPGVAAFPYWHSFGAFGGIRF